MSQSFANPWDRFLTNTPEIIHVSHSQKSGLVFFFFVVVLVLLFLSFFPLLCATAHGRHAGVRRSSVHRPKPSRELTLMLGKVTCPPCFHTVGFSCVFSFFPFYDFHFRWHTTAWEGTFRMTFRLKVQNWFSPKNSFVHIPRDALYHFFFSFTFWLIWKLKFQTTSPLKVNIRFIPQYSWKFLGWGGGGVGVSTKVVKRNM